MEKLTEKQKSLLTLMTDKIKLRGYMMGAHRHYNWRDNPTYANSNVKLPRDTLDRIGKIEYYQSPHVDEDKHDIENECYLGEDLYDHSLHVLWKEPFGKGWKTEPSASLKESMKIDSDGNYHAPCDDATWIILYHPNKQKNAERVLDFALRAMPHWRPTYHYTRKEVIEALKIMCETFEWEFEDCGKTGTLIMRSDPIETDDLDHLSGSPKKGKTKCQQ